MIKSKKEEEEPKDTTKEDNSKQIQTRTESWLEGVLIFKENIISEKSKLFVYIRHFPARGRWGGVSWQRSR